MENQREEQSDEARPVSPAPVLGYRVPGEEERAGPRWWEVIFGSVAITAAVGMFGSLLLLLLSVDQRSRDGDIWTLLFIVVLMVLGTIAAIRSAWYYLSGWSRMQQSDRKTAKAPWILRLR